MTLILIGLGTSGVSFLTQLARIAIKPIGGIKVDPNTFRIINEYTPNMYAIGQVAKGSLFSTNAFWFNAKTASNIAKNLLLTYPSNLKYINLQQNNVNPRSFL